MFAIAPSLTLPRAKTRKGGDQTNAVPVPIPSLARLCARGRVREGAVPFVAIFFIALLSACSGPSNESAKRGKVLIERWAASAGDPAALDPANAIYTLPQASIPYALFDQLMTYDPQTGKVVPMLAASVTPNENATVWTFTLRGSRPGNPLVNPRRPADAGGEVEGAGAAGAPARS